MMKLALSIAHASWRPHRSGYPSEMSPDEYGLSRRIVEALAVKAAAAGHSVLVVEKRGRCDGTCDPRRCSRYAASIVNASRECAGSDLAVEFHIDHRSTGNSGAIALCNNSDLAEAFAGAMLDEWTQRAPIGIAGRGVYRGGEVSRLFGRKWFLDHGARAAVIIELGNVASATDSAYLLTPAAAGVAAEAAEAALLRCISAA